MGNELPAVLVREGTVLTRGRYPTRKELQKLLNLVETAR